MHLISSGRHELLRLCSENFWYILCILLYTLTMFQVRKDEWSNLDDYRSIITELLSILPFYWLKFCWKITSFELKFGAPSHLIFGFPFISPCSPVPLPHPWLSPSSSPLCLSSPSLSRSLCIVEADHLPLEELHPTRLPRVPAAEERRGQEEPAVWVSVSDQATLF